MWNRLYVPSQYTKDVFEVYGLPVTQARNLAIKHASKLKAKYILFVDDDIVAPNNALSLLLELIERTRVPMVAGDYVRKIQPFDSAHVKGTEISEGLYEAELCAMGFTLIDIKQCVLQVVKMNTVKK